MIFAALGHPVDQKKIVSRVFGTLACMPSGNTSNIIAVLNSPWIDDNGQTFQPRVVAAYDAFNGINFISNNFIID
jgi:hypothetical protein